MVFMRALVLDGSRMGEHDLEPVRQVMTEELSALDWDVEVLQLRDIEMKPCTGCFRCWTKTPGICVIKDDAHEVTRKIVQSDLFVILTPVTFGGYSSEIKNALDRSLGIILPTTTKINGHSHHKPRYKRYPSWVVMGSVPSPDPELEALLRDLVGRNVTHGYAPSFSVEVVTEGQDIEEVRKLTKDSRDRTGVTG